MFMNKRNQIGATLVELVLAIAIIVVGVFGIVSSFRLTVINSANPVTKKQAVLIAESLMEEILSKSFTKPTGGYSGLLTSANRDKFDTITDYNNLSINPISTIAGTNVVGLDKYSATITTTNVALGTIASSNVILVTVSITGPNDSFILKAYRINYDN